MNISFTGIKNIGYIKFAEPTDIRYQLKSRYLSAELTDDVNGKHLSEYRQAVKKMDNKNFSYYENSNCINVEATLIKGDENPLFCLNGTYLEPSEKNMPMFDFIANLTSYVKNMKNDTMKLERDFIDLDADEVLVGIGRFSMKQDEGIGDDIKKYYNPENVKKGSTIVNDLLQRSMTFYFDK